MNVRRITKKSRIYNGVFTIGCGAYTLVKQNLPTIVAVAVTTAQINRKRNAQVGGIVRRSQEFIG